MDLWVVDQENSSSSKYFKQKKFNAENQLHDNGDPRQT